MILLSVLLLMQALHLPIKWSKVAGGTTVQWVGFELNTVECTLGLSENRSLWLCNWMSTLIDSGVADMDSFHSSLGRMSFTCGALRYDRPFLSPLYAWAALCGTSGTHCVPTYILIVLHHLRDRFRQRRAYPCAAVAVSIGEAYRIDVKGEGAPS